MLSCVRVNYRFHHLLFYTLGQPDKWAWFLNFLLQNLEMVGNKEEVLNLLVRRTEQCKKLESKISGTHTSRFHHISFVPIEWEHSNFDLGNLFLIHVHVGYNHLFESSFTLQFCCSWFITSLITTLWLNIFNVNTLETVRIPQPLLG